MLHLQASMCNMFKRRFSQLSNLLDGAVFNAVQISLEMLQVIPVHAQKLRIGKHLLERFPEKLHAQFYYIISEIPGTGLLHPLFCIAD